MKKFTFLILSILTVCLSVLFGCSQNKNVSVPQNDEITEQTQTEKDSEQKDDKSDCPDCPDEKPMPRKGCKRNKIRPPRRKVVPQAANKKSPV